MDFQLAYNKCKGVRVKNTIDHFIHPVSDEQYSSLLNNDLILESCSLEDIENTLFLGVPTAQDMMLEAITSKSVRIKNTMLAFVRSLNKATAPTGITVSTDIEISKPRKSGMVAIITAKMALSDGQSISVIFHAPDNDPLKINPDDTLIAFRFLLNSRDVTHVVAPSGGQDLSLAQATTALSNLAEKNSEKFKQAQAEKEALKKEIDDADKQSLELESQLATVNDEIIMVDEQIQETQNSIESLQKRIDRENTLQEKLRSDKSTQAPKLDPINDSTNRDERLGKLRFAFTDKVTNNLLNIENVDAKERKKLVKMANQALGTGLSPKKGEGVKEQAKRIAQQMQYVIGLQGETNVSLNAKFKNTKEIRAYMAQNGIKAASIDSRNQLINKILSYRDNAFNTFNSTLEKAVTLNDIRGMVEREIPVPLEDIRATGFDSKTLIQTGDIAYSIALDLEEVPPLSEQGPKYSEVAQLSEQIIAENYDGLLQHLSDKELFIVDTQLSSIMTDVGLTDPAKKVLQGVTNDPLVSDAVIATTGSMWIKQAIQEEADKRNITRFDLESIAGSDRWREIVHSNNRYKTQPAKLEDGTVDFNTINIIDKTTNNVIESHKIDPTLDRNKESAAVFQRAKQLNNQNQADIISELYSETNKTNDDGYWYGMRIRPFGIGSQPDGHTAYLPPEEAQAKFTDFTERDLRFGAIAYSSPLTREQVEHYNLTDLQPLAPDGDIDYAKVALEDAVSLYMEGLGVTSLSQNTVDNLLQSYRLQKGDNRTKIQAVLGKELREDFFFKNRKTAVDEYKIWYESLNLIDIDMLSNYLAELVVTNTNDNVIQGNFTSDSIKTQVFNSTLSEFKQWAAVKGMSESEAEQIYNDTVTIIQNERKEEVRNQPQFVALDQVLNGLKRSSISSMLNVLDDGGLGFYGAIDAGLYHFTLYRPYISDIDNIASFSLDNTEDVTEFEATIKVPVDAAGNIKAAGVNQVVNAIVETVARSVPTDIDLSNLPAYGSKSEELNSNKEIAAEIRKSIKSAISQGLLPKIKVSVKQTGYNNISVTVTDMPDNIPLFSKQYLKARAEKGDYLTYEDRRGISTYSQTAKAIDTWLKAELGQYHWDESDSMTDYFNSRFGQDVGFDSELEKRRLKEELAAYELNPLSDNEDGYQFVTVDDSQDAEITPLTIITPKAKEDITTLDATNKNSDLDEVSSRLIEAGGVEWQKGRMHRIYFNADMINQLAGNPDPAIAANRKSKLWYDVTYSTFEHKNFIDDDIAQNAITALTAISQGSTPNEPTGDLSEEAEQPQQQESVTASEPVTQKNSHMNSPEIAEQYEKLASLEALQDRMKKANALLRKHKYTLSAELIDAMAEIGISESQTKQLIEPDFAGRQGYPSYALTNNNAKIKNTKSRIAALETKAAAADAVDGENETFDVQVNGANITVTVNHEEDRIQIDLNTRGKPTPGSAEEVIKDKLKTRGFKFSRRFDVWQRKITNNTYFSTASVLGFRSWAELKASASNKADLTDIDDQVPAHNAELEQAIQAIQHIIDNPIDDINVASQSLNNALQVLEQLELVEQYESLLTQASENLESAVLQQARELGVL